MHYPTEKQKILINNIMDDILLYLKEIVNEDCALVPTKMYLEGMSLIDSRQLVANVIAIKEIFTNINNAIRLNEYSHGVAFIKRYKLDKYYLNVQLYFDMPNYAIIESGLMEYLDGHFE